MNVKVFGYKVHVETLVIGAVLGILICRNLLCGCSLVEGMDDQAANAANNMADAIGGAVDESKKVSEEEDEKEKEDKKEDKKDKKSGMKNGSSSINELMTGLQQKIEGLKEASKEGFSNVGDKTMNGVNGSFEGAYENEGWREGAGEAHQGTQVPLPAGEMFFFAHNKFSPQCRSSYSASNGQACLSKEQIDYLNMRGGNRTLADGF